MQRLFYRKYFWSVLFLLIAGFLASGPAVSAAPLSGFYYQAYLAANADLPQDWGLDECMNHYRLYGANEKRATAFSLEAYLAANPDLPQDWTLADALNHYNNYGKFENRLLGFSAAEYLSLYADLPQTWSDAEAYAHYVSYGSQEGRISSFDEVAYLQLYSDFPSTWGQAESFYHYEYYGMAEGRVYDHYDEGAFEDGATNGDEIYGMFLGAYSGASELTPMLDEVLEFLNLFLSDDPSLPLTVTPSLDSIDLSDPSSLPPSITAVLDFGEGYTASNGAVYSGSATVLITDIVYDATGLSLNVSIIVDNLTRDGIPIMDGEMNLTAVLDPSDESDVSAALTLTMTEMDILTDTYNGSITVDVPGVSILSEPITFDPITVTFISFQAGINTISGPLVLAQDSATAYTLDVDLVINGQDFDGVFVLDISDDDTNPAFTVSTQGTVAIMGYELQVNDVVFDPEACEEYPVSGYIVVTMGDETNTMTFSAGCDGYDFE